MARHSAQLLLSGEVSRDNAYPERRPARLGAHDRLAGVLAGVRGGEPAACSPIALTEQLPLCFTGGPVVPNIALGNATAAPVSPGALT